MSMLENSTWNSNDPLFCAASMLDECWMNVGSYVGSYARSYAESFKQGQGINVIAYYHHSLAEEIS